MMWSALADRRLAQWLRGLCLAGIVLNLFLSGVRVALFSSFFAQSAALVYLFEPAVLLLIYAAVVFALTANVNDNRQIALQTGTIVGLIAGALWIVNLAGETFTTLNSSFGILSTAPFLLGGFARWVQGSLAH